MNHSLPHRLLSALLAVLVLTSSVGLTVQRHTCRMSGRSQVQVSLLTPEADRCGMEVARSAPTTVRDNCCDVSSHLHKVTAATPEFSVTKVLVPPLLAVWLPEQVWPKALGIATVTGLAGVRWFAADSSPPPLGGRYLLARVCKLVV